MYIQDKVAWNAGVDKKLAHLKTLGVDCVALDLTDPLPTDGGIDLSTPKSAAGFFEKAKATVAAHGLELRTVLATSGYEDIKKGTAGRDEKIARLVNALSGMGAAGIPILAYNFKLLNSKNLRSQPTQGRGAAQYISFDYEQYLKKPASAGRIRDFGRADVGQPLVLSESDGARRGEIGRAHGPASGRPAGSVRDTAPRRRGARRVEFRSIPEDLRDRAVGIEWHALLPGLREGDERRQRVRRDPGHGIGSARS